MSFAVRCIMADNRNSPVCFDADINLFAPVEKENCALNGEAHDTRTLSCAKVYLQFSLLKISIFRLCYRRTVGQTDFFTNVWQIF